MKPSLLLGALIALSLPATAHAEDEAKGSCSGTVITACGLKIVKSVCTSNVTTDDDKNEAFELHGADDGHSVRTQSLDIGESDGKNTYRKDDDIPPSAYPGSEQNYNFTYTDPQGVVHNVPWNQRMGTSPDNKITICHRMGGARVTLDIPDDQFFGVRAHGHGNHEMDTLGRCEDQEDGSGNDDPAKIAAAVKLSNDPSVTPSVAGCLAAPAGTTVSVTLSGGTTWTGPAPGCNASGVSCGVPFGQTPASPGPNGPDRAGVRTLR